jgi:hypothetical protein
MDSGPDSQPYSWAGASVTGRDLDGASGERPLPASRSPREALVNPSSTIDVREPERRLCTVPCENVRPRFGAMSQ